MSNFYCVVDGAWTTWTTWSKCSVTCNVGNRRRERECTNPTPAHGGSDCSALGDSVETESCNDKPCPGQGFHLLNDNIVYTISLKTHTLLISIFLDYLYILTHFMSLKAKEIY